MKRHFLPVCAAIFLPLATPANEPAKSPVNLQVIVGANVGADVAPSPTPSPSPAAPLPPPPPVVPFEKMLPLLPSVPEGWTAEKPGGSVTDVQIFRLSMAARTYIKGDDQSAAVTTVTLLDAGGHPEHLAAIRKEWSSPDGKQVTAEGYPGYEYFNQNDNRGLLSVIVDKRFLVQVDVVNQEPLALREWFRKVDLKKLSELK